MRTALFHVQKHCTSDSRVQPDIRRTVRRKGQPFFDLARWISGKEPEEPIAMGSVLVDPAFRDVGEHDIAVI